MDRREAQVGDPPSFVPSGVLRAPRAGGERSESGVRMTETEERERRALHLADRHLALGLTDDDVVGMYRTILLARVLDQKVWA